jgi:hypothetical protein
MNYKKHYDLLISRAKTRTITGYKERHHIIPRCLGGSDEATNLVDLLPEEHYVAHQLLVKIYPNCSPLIKAAAMMCINSLTQQRNSNKMYGWLRKRLADVMKQSQQGSGNSQFGTVWIANLSTKECKKVNRDLLEQYLNEGWIKKRIINWETTPKTKTCPSCQTIFFGKGNTCSISCGNKLHYEKNKDSFPFLKGHLESIIENHNKGMSIYKCLIEAGLSGTGNNHTKLKNILKNL